MKRTLEMISWLSLALLVAGPLLFYAQSITLETTKHMMLAATAAWFATALCWMGRR